VSKFCVSCGSAITPGEKFCRQCGLGIGLGALRPGASAVNLTSPVPSTPASFQEPRLSAVENPAPIQYALGRQSPIVERQPSVQVQVNVLTPHSPVQTATDTKGTYGLPIPSMIIGIIVTLSLFDNSKWDSDQINGGVAFCIAGLTLGIVSLSRQRKGKGMAVAGVILSSLGLLGLLGRLP
jgi:hypothetical protein